ncbi:ATP-grasp domain-containing protein [Bradymonas sediminis]|uniref:Transcriptional regulator n=1 Tax=Bradymonas sediminis TaxID=1548548 RepID=A0A2Z4FQ41_9DELT|nr:ATP-grasp domain-containing protein [Bradymonas sediminis]AWV91147.1 transcriptional regulator [Bradymonas sediminis]TDP73706.1 carbamoyl-phosphate synthase large subunit [Bradymonas sediminis]
MSNDTFNILLSAAGRRVSLLKILKQTLSDLSLDGKVYALEMSRAAPAFHIADHGFLAPRCTDPGFVDRVLDICAQNDIKLIIPTIDPALAVYAANLDRFEAAGVTVAISGPKTIEIASNKRATHRWLSDNGFPTPRQAELEDVLANPQDWTFPVATKPADGSRSIGFGIVNTPEELRAFAGPNNIVQSVATGEEYTVSFYVDRQGKCRCAVPRKRLEVRSGEVSKGMTVRNAAIEKLAMAVGDALPDAFGALNVQIFHDAATDELNIIEINPRFGGGFPLAWQAGAHYPQWIVEEVLGHESSANADQWKDRLVMLRFDDAVFLNADEAGL